MTYLSRLQQGGRRETHALGGKFKRLEIWGASTVQPEGSENRASERQGVCVCASVCVGRFQSTAKNPE